MDRPRISLIIGGARKGGLLDSLRRSVPERRWRVPAGDEPAAQIRFLLDSPLPSGGGEVYADVQGDWTAVQRKGWRVLWCADSQPPVGTVPLPDEVLHLSVSDLAERVWGMPVRDPRMVGNVLRGVVANLGTVLYVTSATGGVGKTTGSRRLCERAARNGIRTLLVDGNMGQGSQRSWFDLSQSKPLRSVSNWRPGKDPRMGANWGERQLGVKYDVAFAPPSGTSVGWDAYHGYIEAARAPWQFVVVDLDLINAKDLRDGSTAAGGLLVPALRSHDLCLFIVKAGVQTQGDAVGVLSALSSKGVNIPLDCIGIKDVMPVGMDSYKRLDYRRYGVWLGEERQSEEAGRRLARGDNDWADPLLDETRERVLAWALPDRGFDPGRLRPKKTRGRWGRK